MKIVHVVHAFPDPPTGGTERVVRALAEAMQHQGHDVAVVSGSLEQAPTTRVDERRAGSLRVLDLHRDDLWFERWEKTWSPGVSATFAALLERERPDVVHVHHWLRLSSDLARTAQRTGVPVVAVSLHDYFAPCATPRRLARDEEPGPPERPSWMGEAEAAEAFAFHRADFAAEIRSADLRFAPCQAHVVGVQALAAAPLGDILEARPPLLEVPDRLPKKERRGRKLLHWGSLYPEKGLETVLEALASVGSGFELDVLGEADDAEWWATVVQRCASLPVRFHGRFATSDLARFDADYAVLPSWCAESYGLVVDEARCLGLPMIASDLPAYREHAPAASTAFFAPGDPGALAQILADEAALGALEAPEPPPIETAETAAQRLLDRYEEARLGRHGPLSGAPGVDDRMRAELLFRRAERRFWTALQQPRPPAPPDDFLAR